MTLKQARKELEKLGFRFTTPHWGTMPPEEFTNDLIACNHWKPSGRDVYIANRYDKGVYITSSIHGMFRRYKARYYNEYRREFGNIFAYGKTLQEAVKNFIRDFTNKNYNVSK
jgi:hypothetical protein